MVHWLTCWDTHVCQKLAHLDVGINARGRQYPKMPCRTWTFYLFLPDWHFLRGIYEIFDISQVSYFLCKLGTTVNQCALVSSVSDYFWIFGGPDKFWPKRRRRQVMPGGWIFQKWNHFHDKTTHWDAENDFYQKSRGCYHYTCVPKIESASFYLFNTSLHT